MPSFLQIFRHRRFIVSALFAAVGVSYSGLVQLNERLSQSALAVPITSISSDVVDADADLFLPLANATAEPLPNYEQYG